MYVQIAMCHVTQAKVVRDTNSMVEEFMLAANVSSAERIFSEFPDCAMLRRHPAPPPSNFDPLVKAARTQGFDIKVDTGKELADSLDAAVDPGNPYFNTMLRMIGTRYLPPSSSVLALPVYSQ